MNNNSTAFDTVLIANRGAIALRIARTCKDLGYRVIMIYAPNDCHLPLLTLADEVVCCDYLDQSALIALAQAVGAAIHPGYGFLSERTDFAQACSEAGVTFIGPSFDVLALTGLKHVCADILKGTHVPVLPCVHLSAESTQNATELSVCDGLAFPLMVKPSAAGGGLGMQWVTEPNDLGLAIKTAGEMGLHYFQSGEVMVEQALENVRHVEVQLLADSYGAVRAIGDRECSLQRRRQKVIETSPAPLSDVMRQRVHAYAEEVGHAIGLNQVATVEFLWDGDTFWFLEVNPRLQVEHGVTEALNGMDIVACQLAFARGESLEKVLHHWPQNNGFAIQARIYAEDPQTGLPASGLVTCLELPTGQGLRIESGAYVGMNVSVDYDPLLMKIIAHAPTPEQCRQRLLRALQELVLQGSQGLKTNQEKLIQIIASQTFADNHYHTRSLTLDFAHAEPCLFEDLAVGIVKGVKSMNDVQVSAPSNAYQNWKPSHWI